VIVVADTSPLNYLVLIGEIDLLLALYGKILMPRAVYQELQRSQTPLPVHAWASSLPEWCEVRTVIAPIDSAFSDLDPGEREAIQLAVETGADMLLIDEIDGRKEALRHHLRVTGTVAILEQASQRGLIDFRSALERLEKTSFRLSPTIRETFLKRNP
jgi:predicted nucleic acid-binding protein